MFAADRTNTNSLDTSNTSGVNSTQASVLGSSSDKNVLSTENLFTAKSSSSTSCLPDLVIENATNPERAGASTKIQISYTLKNIGGKDAGRHFVGYYLSQDEKWDNNDKLLETNSFDTVQSLKAGESISLSKEFTLDKNIAAGDYYLLYVADDFNEVAEGNETNNVFAKKITIDPTSPDLIIEDGSAPDNARAGDKIQLSYKEKNIGNGDAGEHRVAFYLSKDDKWDSSDSFLGSNRVKRLTSGKYVNRTKSFTLDSNLTSGDYYLLYVSDDNSSVTESNETNNTFSRRISIRNAQGSAINHSLNDEPPIDPTPSLPLDEGNEDSIEIEKFGITAAAPDLRLEVENDESPARAKAGSEITLSYKEKNLGSGDANAHSVGFYLSKDDKWDSSDILIGEDSVNHLSTNKYISHTKTFTLDSNIASGDYYLVYVGDNKFDITETDENNNIVAKAITIRGNTNIQSLNDIEPPIDPTPSLPLDEGNEDSIEIEKFGVTTASPDLRLEVENDKSPARGKAGSDITLAYKEKNLGNGDAGAHSVGFYLSKDDKWDSSDILLGEDSVNHVSTNKYISQTKSFTLDSNIASGDYYLIYAGDNKSEITETDENNNIVAKAITIRGNSFS